MTSLVDSSAHLTRRCKELELSESCCVALEGLGLTSLGRLAYAVGSPSESASETQYQAWFEEHLPSTSIGDRSIVKRLITEAQTIVCAELREQVTSNLDAATVRKVPEAEREARMAELRRRLVGLQLEGANEPSHHLLDLCTAQERSGQLVYIEPSKCTSRIHEVTHHKPQSQSVHVESQKLVLKPGESVPEINPSSALQALEALRRRGIAMTFAGSVSYPGYDRYLNKLFSHLSRDPPPGMARITVSQIVAADKQVFVRLIEAGIRPKRADDKSFPMDAALMTALESYEVSFLLLHAAVSKPPKRPPPRLTRGGQKDDDPKKPRKGNGKGAQKTSTGGPRVPKAIMDLGGHAMTPDGSECCYGYNLGKCNVKGCKRKHVCCKCFGSHPITACKA